MWTDQDQRCAYAEGWGLFKSNGRIEIQRLDSVDAFDDDADATDFVILRADAGCKVCRKALIYAQQSC